MPLSRRPRLGPRSILLAPLMRYLGRLRFRNLFLITATLFLVDLAVPDLIPLVDELLLGLATLILGTWRTRKRGRDTPDLTADRQQ